MHRIANLGGTLQLAYGDYGADTGPIHALALNAADDTVTDEATFHTEETWIYREYAGTKYAAYMDPQGGEGNPENGQYASNDGTGWTIHTNVTPVPVHVMDLIVTAEGIFLFGAANEPDPPNGGGTAWHSADNGATWDVSLAPRPDPTNFARFYAACVLGTDLFTVLDDGAGAYHVYRRTAGVWSLSEDITGPVSGLVPFTINGVAFAVIIPNAKQVGTSKRGPTGVLTAIEDAASRTTLLAALPPTVRDANVAAGILYVLDGPGALWAIDNVGTKTRMLTLPTTATCFAVEGTAVYFGTTDSKVYKTALPT